MDIPSGIDSDSGAVFPSHIAAADVTVTLHLPKRGLWLHPGGASAGKIVVVPIGIPRALEAKLFSPECELLDEEWGRAAFAPRRFTAHKNDFGHVLAVLVPGHGDGRVQVDATSHAQSPLTAPGGC